MKATKKERAPRAETFGDLMRVAGKTPAMLEVDTRVSAGTVYRAKRGLMPTDANVAALAAGLGVTADACRAAIEAAARARGAA